MSNKDLARVVLGLSADVNTLKRDMNKADKTVETSAGKMRRSTEKAAKGMDRAMRNATGNIGQSAQKAGALVVRSLAAPIAALAAGGAVTALRGAASSIAAVGDEARRAGVGLQAFQEWKFVAEQNRIAVDAMADSFRELGIRADEFITTGSGGGAEAFARLGYTADELALKLQNPSALMLEIIDRTRQLGDVAAQQRIFDEIFAGQGAEQLIRLLGQSQDELRGTIDQAHDLGVIMSEELVDNAAELDRKFNAIATTVETGLKTAIVNAAGALGDFIKTFNDFITGANDVGAGFGGNQPWSQLLTDEQWNQMANLDLPLAGMRNQNTNFYEGFNFGDDGNMVLAPPPAPPSTGGSGGGGGRASSTSAAEREAAAVLKLIETLEWEQETIGMTAKELAVASALRDAGSAATAEQRAQVEQLVLSNFDLQASVDAQAEAMENLRESAEQALGTIIQGFLDGKDAGEIFSNVLRDIGSQLLNMGISTLASAIFPGAGAGAGFIGSTFNFSEAA